MLLVYRFKIFGYGDRNFDIARAKRHPTKRGIKNIVFAFKVSCARVLAAKLVPLFGGDDKLAAILKVLPVNGKGFAYCRDAGRSHKRVRAAQCAIEDMG